jgi:hypothetical protein
MEPVGLMWGNDPGITPTMVRNNGIKLKETWINPRIGTKQHLGWAGRLNGLVDNPESSCLSCHAVAEHPQTNQLVPAGDETLRAWQWFRNVRSGEPFDVGDPKVVSLDYSLQLGVGIQHFEAERQALLTQKRGPIPAGQILQEAKSGLTTPGGRKVFPVTRQDIDVSTRVNEYLNPRK